MPVYEYTALNDRGRKLEGIADADSPVAVRQKLRTSGLYPITVSESRHPEGPGRPRAGWIPHLPARVRPSEITLVTRQLAILTGAGFQLVAALDALMPQVRSPALKTQLAQIKDAIVEGGSFAGALALFPRTFSPLYVNMVRAGEASGTLEIVLERLAEITEKQQQLRSRIRSALAYPALMAVIGTLVLFFLLTVIVPSITTIFQDLDQALPAPTRMLIATADFLRLFWWALLLAAACGWLVYRGVARHERGRWMLDRVKLRLPGIGPLVRKLAAARLARTLGSLLENGVPLMVALEIVQNVAGNAVIGRMVEDAAREVGKGQPLGAALEASDALPYLAIQMVQVGEQSGQLESVLKRTAAVFEGEVETSVMNLTTLLEPLMILAMGVAVGFVVLAICLPIFEMNQLVM